MLTSQLICLIGIVVGTYTGQLGVAGLVVQAMLGDFGNQMSQTACRSNIYTIDPKAKNRVNTALMTFVFAGQMTGTAVGSSLYDRFEWVGSGTYSVVSIVVALGVCLVRGPWEEGWIGWEGGWQVRKKNKETADGKTVENGVFEDVERGEGQGGGDEEMAIEAKKAPSVPAVGIMRSWSNRIRAGEKVRSAQEEGPSISRWREEGLVEVPLNYRKDRNRDDDSEDDDEGDELRRSKDDGESDDEQDGIQGIGRHASDSSRHTRFFSVRSGSTRSH